MIDNGVKNAKKISYALSHETCYYDHYFSYNKNQDQAINEEITSDYVPFITMMDFMVWPNMEDQVYKWFLY